MSDPEADVLYHELLDALTAGGCALCRLGERAADSYLNALLYEGVTDPATRQVLRDARGPCYRHAWRMAHKRGAVLGTAIVYRDVINTLTKMLDAQPPGAASFLRRLGRGAGDLPRRLAASAACPACGLEADAVRRSAATLLKYTGQAQIATAYVSAGGLCLPHLQTVLAQASADAAGLLAAWQAEAWSRLRAELDELIRKHDHRFRQEPVTEAEGTAWQRAVAAVVSQWATPEQGNSVV